MSVGGWAGDGASRSTSAVHPNRMMSRGPTMRVGLPEVATTTARRRRDPPAALRDFETRQPWRGGERHPIRARRPMPRRRSVCGDGVGGYPMPAGPLELAADRELTPRPC